MKIKRILSTALTAAILFTTIVSAIPVGASAQASFVGDKGTISNDDIKAQYLDPMLAYNYGSAGEMLSAELAQGSLDYVNSADGKYAMYVNRYTGVFYYVNNVTGQILTSNPYNPAYTTLDSAIKKELMSQVFITFSSVGSTAVPKIYDSFKAGDLATAQQYQYKINRVIDAILRFGKFGAIRGVKAALEMKGYDVGHAVFPAPHYDKDTLAAYKKELESLGIEF